MADELDFLELLIASERISKWVRVISSAQASQAAKCAMSACHILPFILHSHVATRHPPKGISTICTLLAGPGLCWTWPQL